MTSLPKDPPLNRTIKGPPPQRLDRRISFPFEKIHFDPIKRIHPTIFNLSCAVTLFKLNTRIQSFPFQIRSAQNIRKLYCFCDWTLKINVQDLYYISQGLKNLQALKTLHLSLKVVLRSTIQALM